MFSFNCLEDVEGFIFAVVGCLASEDCDLVVHEVGRGVVGTGFWDDSLNDWIDPW